MEGHGLPKRVGGLGRRVEGGEKRLAVGVEEHGPLVVGDRLRAPRRMPQQ